MHLPCATPMPSDPDTGLVWVLWFDPAAILADGPTSPLTDTQLISKPASARVWTRAYIFVEIGAWDM